MAIMAKDTRLNEKKAKLKDFNEEITCQCSQFASAHAARDCAFAYGYGVGILRFRSLMTNPFAELTHLDLNLFKLQGYAHRDA